jgi:hypothetical protein
MSTATCHDVAPVQEYVDHLAVTDYLNGSPWRPVTGDDDGYVPTPVPTPMPVPVSQRVLEAIEASPYDFRTPTSLAAELHLPEDEVRTALNALGDQVRRPVGGGREYEDWYRVTARGLTWRERWWRLRAYAGHTAPGI